MGDLSKTRNENLKRILASNFKSKSELGRALGKTPSHIGSWFAESGYNTGVGDKSAREIEKKFELEPYFLDEDNSHLNDDDFKVNQKKDKGIAFLSGLKVFFNNLNTDSEATKSDIHAIKYAKNSLEQLGYQVQFCPSICDDKRSMSMMVIHGQIALPDLLLTPSGREQSFYIDIYEEKRLKLINVSVKTKSKDVLFVKKADIGKIEDLVKAHIDTYFSE